MESRSAIMNPKTKDVIVHDGKVTVQGWAYSGNGNWVERVEVSPDGGHVWYACAPEDLTQKIYSVNRSKPATAKRLRQLEEMGQPLLPITQPLEFTVEKFEEYEAAYQRAPREPIDEVNTYVFQL
ncbi:hypothetical protein EIP86_000425 [Pleurotus ostreatoroseus]|nr:hypothetical protein EIP86_000425 [Pleurotus ostreatoroseus]